jgi:segregation and condensation protein B
MYLDRAKDKAAIEALLFATKGLSIDEIARRTGVEKKEAEELLEEIEIEHEKEEKGIHVVQEGNLWKMSVKPEVTVKVKDILPPELPKGLTKTLAIIAANKPVKQSLVVRVRGNKAYDHVKKLAKLGFITAEEKGSTKVLDLTQKFFDYFRVSEESLKKEAPKLEITEEGE